MEFANGYRLPEVLEATEDDLFGDFFMVSDKFSFDGRSEDYEHVFDYEHLTGSIWVDGEYHLVGCIDFEPDCVLLKFGDEAVGFYMGGQAWIDPQHRGKGFGAKMIVGCIAMTQTLPNVANIGFSEAGFETHRSAMRLLVDLQSVPRPTN